MFVHLWVPYSVYSILINSALLLYLKKSWDIHPDCPAPISPKQRVPVIRIHVKFLDFPPSLGGYPDTGRGSDWYLSLSVSCEPPSPPGLRANTPQMFHIYFMWPCQEPQMGRRDCATVRKKSSQEPYLGGVAQTWYETEASRYSGSPFELVSPVQENIFLPWLF